MAQGITGVQGPTGVQGLTGVMGITGPDGITGTSPTGVRGETGVRGITGVKGLTGIQGLTGVQGLTGIMGITGQEPTGEQGRTGVQGLTGTPGLTGVQGVTGAQPAQGITGVRGITGTFGATGAMPTGAQGVGGATGVMGGATGVQGVTGIGPTGNQPTGVQGLTGARGLTGVKGLTGEAPTGVLGITGVQGLTGVKGLTGEGLQDTGVEGATGADGITGPQGMTGESPTGIQGITGIRGITGVKGITGSIGITGVQGLTGNVPTGVQGLTGAAGVTTGVQGITGVSTVTGVQGLTGAIPPALNTAYVEQMTTQTVTGTTAFATAATLASGSFTPGRKYLIVANALQSVDSISGGTNMKLFHGSTIFAGSHKFLDAPASTTARYTYSYFTVWTAVAGESITLQFNTDSVSNIARADQITIFAIEISEQLSEGVDWFYQEIDESTDLADGNWTAYNNAELNITPVNSGDDWLVMTASNMRGFNATSSYANSRIRHTGDSDDTTPVLTVNPQTGNSIELFCNFRTFTLTNILNYFAEQSQDSGNSSSNARRTYSGIFALNISKFRNHLAAYTDGQTSITNANFGTTVQSGTLNPNWDGKTWALSAYGNIPHNGTGQHARLQTDGADTPAGQTANIFNIENVNDTGEIRPIQFQVFQDLGSKLHTFTNDAGTSASVEEGQYRQIVAFTTDLAVPRGAKNPIQGVTGVQGITGIQGITGVDGSVYGAAFVEVFGPVSHTGDTSYSTVLTLPNARLVTGRKYLLVVNCLWQGATSDPASVYSIHTTHGGTEFTGSLKQREMNTAAQATAYNNYSYMTVFTPAGGEDIVIEMKAGDPANVSNAAQASIFAMDLTLIAENVDWFFDEDTTPVTTGATFVDGGSVTFTPNVAGKDWLILSMCEINPAENVNNNRTSRISRSGEASSTTPVLTEGDGATNVFITLMNAAVFNLGAVSNTFTEQFNNTGSGASGTRDYSAIFALNLAAIREAVGIYTDGSTALSDTAFGTTVQTLPVTISASYAAVWVLGSWANGTNNTGQSVNSRLQTDGADTPSGQTAALFGINSSQTVSTDLPVQFQTVEVLRAGSHTITVDGSHVIANGSVGEFRAIVAIPLLQENLGQQGAMGPTGIKGVTGASPTGIQGITGVKGLTGVLGITGNSPTGASPTGVKGLTGIQGITGARPTGASPTGVLGITGVKGLTGVQGVTGNSPTGASPTGVKGLTGVRGITGTQGITGFQPTGAQPTGALGSPGVHGLTGVQGVTGTQPTGLQGLTGVQGLTGIQGLTGFAPTGFQPTGIQGLTGVDGITGIDGLTGVQGLTGGQVNLDILDWNVTGGLVAASIGSGVDGYAGAPRFGSIVDVIISLKANGTSGTTIVDVFRGTGTLATTPYQVTFGTIFTTAGNRPMIGATAAATNRSRDSAAPNIVNFKKGDVFGIQVSQIATGADGLRVELVVQYTGT